MAEEDMDTKLVRKSALRPTSVKEALRNSPVLNSPPHKKDRLLSPSRDALPPLPGGSLSLGIRPPLCWSALGMALRLFLFGVPSAVVFLAVLRCSLPLVLVPAAFLIRIWFSPSWECPFWGG